MFRKFEKSRFSNPKGFTILELVAVTAIVAVLAGIITTSVAGISEVSQDSQAMRDTTIVGEGATDYFFNRDGMATIIPLELPVSDISPDTVQEINSRWPEDFVTGVYRSVFPADATTTVTEITFVDGDGETLAAAVEGIDFGVNDILAGFTAVDFGALAGQGYIRSESDSASEQTGPFSSYLWLFEKATSPGSPVENASRNLALFKLVVVQKVSADGEHASLVYQRII